MGLTFLGKQRPRMHHAPSLQRRSVLGLALSALFSLTSIPAPVVSVCSTFCFGSTCDELAETAGISCGSLEDLFNCDCTSCACDTVAEFDPTACVDVPGFEDSRNLTCNDYRANAALCDDSQAFTVPGRLAATEACCTCIPETFEYVVPLFAQNIVLGDATRPEMFSSSESGSSASLDDSCWRVNVTKPDATVTLFGQEYDFAYVCANGLISFGAPELSYTPIPFPASDTPIIAPFWADVDVRCGTSASLRSQSGCEGGSYFWQFITAKTNYSEYLHAIDRRIRQIYDPDFEAASLLVATWDSVGYYALGTDLLNSFQAVIATAADGSGDTYACFYYRSLEWTVGIVSAESYAQMGFDAGDGISFYAHPSSFSPDVAQALSNGLPFCYYLSATQICAQGFEFLDGECQPMPCTEFSSGLFEDRYLATDCAFPIDTGAFCNLKCVGGKVASADAAMESTCFAGQLFDPGLSCVEPGIAVAPSRVSLVEGASTSFEVEILSQVMPGLPVALVPNITLLSLEADLQPGASNDAADYIILTSNSGHPLEEIFFDATNFADSVTVNVSAVDNDFVANSASVQVLIEFVVVTFDPGYSGYEPPVVLVSIEDDDFAAVVVDVSEALEVHETSSAACSTLDTAAPGVARIGYWLSSQPYDDVTVVLASTSESLGKLCGRTALVFNVENWAVPQYVVVAAVPNDRDDSALTAPDLPSFVVQGILRSDDKSYQGQDVDDALIMYIDNDMSGISVAEAGTLLAAEGAAGAVVGFVLDSEPLADVVIYITVNDTVNCAVASGHRLTFGPATWATEQFLEVEALEDDLIDDSIVCAVFVDVVAQADPVYNVLDFPNPVAHVRKVDNDYADVKVDTMGSEPIIVAPEGGTALFSVALTARPSLPVVLGFEVLNWNETFSGPSPTVNNGSNFSIVPSLWDSGSNYVVISCAENLRFESIGDANASITGTLNASLFSLRVFVAFANPDADPAFAAATLPDSLLTGYCEDNDMFGVTILSGESSADGVESPVSHQHQEHDIQGERLYEAAALNSPRNYSLFLLSVPSHDVSAECNVYLLDDTTGNRSSADAGNRRVAFSWASSNSDGLFLASSTSVLDTRLDFSLRAVADGIDNGEANEQFCLRCVLSSPSGDPYYDGLYRDFVCGTIIDADIAGLVYSPRTVIATSEADSKLGSTHDIAVNLESRPTAPVSVLISVRSSIPGAAIVVSDENEVSALATSHMLLFLPDTWMVPQTVSVQGLDDNIYQGVDTTFAVIFSCTSEGDPMYDDLLPVELEGLTVDDDAVGLVVRLEGGSNGLVTSESPSATAVLSPPTLSVRLASEPIAAVTVRITSSDSTEAIVGDGSELFVFSALSWNVSQSVSILGVDDDWIDGDQLYYINLGASSPDPMYDGLTAASGNLVNVDDNTAAILGTQSLSSACMTSERDDPLNPASAFNGIAAPSDYFRVPVSLASSPTGGVYLNEAASGTISATNGPGVYNLDSAVIDNDHTPSEWTRSPTADLASCESGSRYVTVDLGSEYVITSVTLWHYYADIRQYCSQSVLLSKTGAFTGEEVKVYSTGTGYGPVETAEGHTINFNATTARYVRHHCGRSTLNTGIHFMEIDVFGFPDVEVSVSSSNIDAGLVAAYPFASSSTTEVPLLFAESVLLVFTPSTWKEPQFIAVRGVDDQVQDGNEEYSLVFTASSAGDPYFGSGTASFPTTSPIVQAELLCVNEDDDVAGLVVVAANPRVTTESEDDPRHALTVNVSLASKPTATVVVSGTSNNTAEGRVAGVAAAGSLFFSAANWDVVQMLEVVGVDDDVVDGPRGYTFLVRVVASGDPVYAGASPTMEVPLVITNLDNDTAGVLAVVTDTEQTPAPTSETGEITRAVNVRLTSQPVAEVVVAMTVSNPTEGTVSASTVILSEATWSTGVNVLVSGVDDFQQDGPADFHITFNVSSADTLYDHRNVEGAPLRFVNLDNDIAGVVIAHDQYQTFESGQGRVVMSIRLGTQPRGDVEVLALVSDITEAALALSADHSSTYPTVTFIFNETNWNVTRALFVWGVDDQSVDGDQAYNLTFSCASSMTSDSVYAALPSIIDTLTNVDDDVPGIIVTRIAACFVISDEGGFCDVQVSLQSEPLPDREVAVQIASANLTEAVLVFATRGVPSAGTLNLSFSSANWNIPQTVSVSGVQIAETARELRTTFTVDGSTTTDPAYAQLVESVQLVFVNNDDGHASASVECSEGDSFGCDSTLCGPYDCSAVLGSPPNGDVNITLAVCRADAEHGESTLTFSATNWNISQMAQLFGLPCAGGSSSGGDVVNASFASNSDSAYDGLSDLTIDAGPANTGLAVASVNDSLTTSEAGGFVDVTVVLKSEPTSDVVVTATSSNLAKGVVVHVDRTLSPSPAPEEGLEITFSSSTWNAPQTIRVIGQDDLVVDAMPGAMSYYLRLLSASADPIYNGRTSEVALTNQDDDTAFIVANITARASDPGARSNSSGIGATTLLLPRTTESGGTFSGVVTLTSSPLMWVVVRAEVSDPSEALVAPETFNFSASVWAEHREGLEFTVTGVDDTFDDGPIQYAVTFSVDQVSPLDHYGWSVDAGTDSKFEFSSCVNEDDDETKLLVDQASTIIVDEAGATQTVALRLASQPFANVVVTASSSDIGEVGLLSGSVPTYSETVDILFTPAVWNVAQYLQISGIPDGVVDGDQTVAISLVASQPVGDDPFQASYTSQSLLLAAMNADEDEGGASASFVGLSRAVSESGPTSLEIAVQLSSRPAGRVTIFASSSDTSAALVTSSSMFAVEPVDWASPVIFVVTAVDNNLDDGDRELQVPISLTCPDDPLFDEFEIPPLDFMCLDDDVSGLAVRTLSGTSVTSEDASGQLVVLVRLLCEPAAGTVAVPVVSSDPSEGVANSTQVVFSRDGTASWWSREQSVVIVGVDDDIPDGTIQYSLTFGPAVVSDGQDVHYAGAMATLLLENLDNDIAGILLTKPADVIPEIFESLASLASDSVGASFSYTLQLDSQPNSLVAVSLVPSDESRLFVTPSNVVFSESNWSAAAEIVVRAIDTSQDDGTVDITIAHELTSDDERFTAIPASSLVVTVINDDVAGIEAEIASDSIYSATNEDGAEVALEVKLTAAPFPGQVVLVTVTSSDTSEAIVEPGSSFLYFTADNFNISRRVTVTGVDDQESDGDVTYQILFQCSNGGGGSLVYSHGNAQAASASLQLVNGDDDFVRILVEPKQAGLAFSTSEDGESIAATLSLSFSPQQNSSMLIYIASADATEVLVCIDSIEQNVIASHCTGDSRQYQSLELTAQNWDSGRTVWFVGADDSVVDGDQEVNITVSAEFISESSVTVVTPPPRDMVVQVLNEDDDVAAIVVDTDFDQGVVSEFGPAATFTVRLSSQPLDDVVLLCASDRARLGVVESPPDGELVFTASNWALPQEVAVLATETDSAEVDTPFDVECSVSSSDPAYAALNGRNPEPLTFLREDLTVAGFSSYKRGYTTSESGRTVEWFVRTLSPPRSPVLVKAACTPPTEAAVSPDRVVLTPGNWQNYQKITIKGLDDDVDDGDLPFDVLFEVATQDAVYKTRPIPTLHLSNVDDDEHGVTASLVEPVSDVLREADPLVGQPIRLNLLSQPVQDVVVTITTSNAAAGYISPSQHVFTAAAWATSARFVVYPVDDDVQQLAAVTQFDAVVSFSSLDAKYSPPTQGNFSFPFSVVDDDQAGLSSTAPGILRLDEGSTIVIRFFLQSEPIFPVRMHLESGTPNEVAFLRQDPTIDGSGLNPAEEAIERTFWLDASNWSFGMNVTVRGVRDDADDGDQLAWYTLSCMSVDPHYNGLNMNKSIEVVDVDVAGLVESAPSSVEDVSENGTATSFSLRLGTAPTSDVYVRLFLSDASECAFVEGASTSDQLVSTAGVTQLTLFFSQATWNIDQIVGIRGVDDDIDDGDQPCEVSVVGIESDDFVYAALLVGSDVSGTGAGGSGSDTLYVIRTLDDDEAGAELTPLALIVSESDAQQTQPSLQTHSALLALRSEPLSPPVLINYWSVDPSQGLAFGTLVFDATNWSDPQRVVVAAVDNSRADGDRHFKINFDRAVSTGPDYNDLDLHVELDVTILDDDAVGVQLEWSSDYEPTSPPSVMFSKPIAAGNGFSNNAPAIGDNTTSSTAAPAEDYDVNQSDWVTLYCSENSTTNFSLTTWLTSEPYGAVTIAVELISTGGGTSQAYDAHTGMTLEPEIFPEGGYLFFEPSNWNTPQTLTMHCLHDWRDDGNRISTLEVATVSLEDHAYDSFDFGRDAMATVQIVSEDADTSGIVVLLGDQARSFASKWTTDVTENVGDRNGMVTSLAPAGATTTSTSPPTSATTTTAASTALRSGSATSLADQNAEEANAASSNARLETNSSGAQDVVVYFLTSRPYFPVSLTLESSMPTESNLSPATVIFSPQATSDKIMTAGSLASGHFPADALGLDENGTYSGEWMVPQMVTVTGKNSSAGKTVVYDLAHKVASNDTMYALLGRKLASITVVNEYPVPTGGDTIVVQNGFNDFGDFLESEDGSIVWYIIAAVAVVVVALTVGLVVMKLSYRKKIERERQQAIAERAAMAAGAQDVDISWNDSELPRTKGKVKGSKIVAVSDGLEVSSSQGDQTETIQRRMGIMVSQMQEHLLQLHAENIALSQQHMVEPFAIEDGIMSSEDASKLLETIKQLKLHNYEIQEGQVSRSAQSRRKKKRSKRRGAAL